MAEILEERDDSSKTPPPPPEPAASEAAPPLKAAPPDETRQEAVSNADEQSSTSAAAADLLAVLGEADPLRQLVAEGYSHEELLEHEANDPNLCLTPEQDELLAHQAHLFVAEPFAGFDVDELLAEHDYAPFGN
ncbi:hypothetical protein [Polyangium sp. 15x6]|uniref:hypothetical protein n=1 Tax=Polyangium sp. 15x6 TaxID=3042687 RepID=UPI002499F1AD|nr:hypothetical protein [Polyangium sp. 15x6]